MVQLAQNITKPLLNVVLGVELFYIRVQFFEIFTLCDLTNFDVILRNTFLDAYEVDIFHSEDKLRVHTKSGFKLVNLDVDYNYALDFMGMNLVSLANELELSSFLILMFLRVSQGEPKPQGGSNPLPIFWIHPIKFQRF
jgi:hypothetical protein